MNILIYNWRDIKNPDAGGAEVFTHEIAKRMVRDGHSVVWFTSKFPNCKKEEVIDGINVIRDGGKYTVYLKAREYYKKYFSKQRFDVIIDEINTIPFFTPKFVKDTKIVTLIHQLAREFWFYETKFPINYLGYHYFENKWLSLYKDIPTMTVSESTKGDLIDLGFKNVSIVPEGIDFKPLDKVGEKEKDPTFIFCGRLKKAKLPDHAIRAFDIVKEKLPDAKLWIVGDGYYRDELEKIANDGVTFFGRVSSEEKLRLMSKAWAILVPGIREGWGLIVTEANAMGTPVIGYNVHGLRDSINDGNGILVNGYEEMGKCAIDFALNKELREEFSVRALENSKRFSWDRSAKEIVNILNSRPMT